MNLAPSLRRPLLFVALAAVSGVAPFACSGPADLRTLDDPKPKTHHDAGKKDSGPKDAGDVDAADHAACNDYAAIICAKLDSCTGNVNVAENYSSTDECIVREALSCITSLDAPDNAASAAGIERCGAGIMAGSCGDFFDHTNLPVVLHRAPRAAAERSRVRLQRPVRQHLVLPAGQRDVRHLHHAGPRPAPPARSTATAAGRACTARAALKTCEPVVAPGSVCDATHLCPYEESCVVPDGGTSGLCTVRGALGSRLRRQADQGAALRQRLRLLLPVGDRHLRADHRRLHRSDVRHARRRGGQRRARSVAQAVCYGGTDCFPTTTSSGFCTPPAADGQPCDSVLGPSCENPARCVPKNPANDASTAGTCLVIGVGTDYCSPPVSGWRRLIW